MMTRMTLNRRKATVEFNPSSMIRDGEGRTDERGEDEMESERVIVTSKDKSYKSEA